MKSYWPVLIVALAACGPGESGDSGGSSSSGSESTGATAPTTSLTSSSVSDTLGTMSDSMSDTTTMTTTMTTDTLGTETTAADSSASADSGSSGSADGSTGSDSGSGSTGGGTDGVYEQCAQDDPPCAEGQMCQDVMQGNYNFCTIPCDSEDDCPAPSSGDAVVNCGGPPMQDTRCQLACTDGEICPDGMECIDVGGGNFALCAWPS